LSDISGYAEVRRDMEARRASAIMRAERYGRRVRSVVWGVTLAWYLAGVGLILFSYHLPTGSWGRVALWGGLTSCSAGPFFTWVVALVVGREHGLWE
jgi:hypothetical protein